jgi:hypothetical protein
MSTTITTDQQALVRPGAPAGHPGTLVLVCIDVEVSGAHRSDPARLAHLLGAEGWFRCRSAAGREYLQLLVEAPDSPGLGDQVVRRCMDTLARTGAPGRIAAVRADDGSLAGGRAAALERCGCAAADSWQDGPCAGCAHDSRISLREWLAGGGGRLVYADLAVATGGLRETG